MLLLYWPAVDFPLLALDDPYYVRNELVGGGLTFPNVVRCFTGRMEDMYIPLTHLSFMADAELFGATSRGFHLTNVALHSLNMGLLLLLLWRMSGALWLSAAAAALVALHPLRVESVAWVAERKDVLAVFFLMLSLACHLRFVRTRKRRWYGALFACAVFGMLSKPIMVILPLLLLLLDFWPLGRFQAENGEGRSPKPFPHGVLALAVEKLPLAALSAGVALATVFLQRDASFHAGISPASRVEHSLSSAFIYLYRTAWPRDLVFRLFHEPWTRYSGTLIPAAAGFAVVTALVARAAGRRPYLAFAWGWYLAALFPVSGIVPAGAQWISDRFTYIPHIGLAVGAVWLAAGLPVRRFRPVLPALAAVVIVAFALLARRQLGHWKDGVTLFARGIEQSRDNPRYMGIYARELMAAGDLRGAREQQERILRFAADPVEGPDIQRQYLEILDDMGDREGAISRAREFLRATPGFRMTRIHLADDLFGQGRFREAVEEFRRVLDDPRIPPIDRAYALEGAGLSLWKMGLENEALASYEEGLGANPGSVSIRYNAARLLAGRGDARGARARYEEALRVAPENVRVRMALGDLLLGMGEIAAAAAHFEQVARRVPGKAESYYAQARIQEAGGMTSRARALYESALAAPAVLPETPASIRRRLEAGAGRTPE